MACTCLKSFLGLFFFLPVNDRRILLSAYSGDQYAGNVKCVSEYLLEHGGKETELIWAFKQPEKFQDVSGIKTVKYYSARWFYSMLTAGVIVTDVGVHRFYHKRKNQFLLETWHGGGAYKRVGINTHLAHTFSAAEIRSRLKAMNEVDLFVSSSSFFSHYAIREDNGYTGEIINSGMPQNDIFFSDKRRRRASKKVREALGLHGYLVLYAPTFRGEKIDGLGIDYGFPYEDVLRALRERGKESVTLLKRAHHRCIMFDRSPDEVIDVSDYPDMQELLCAADMLITDYSSSMWDFALLGRPCMLYVTDLEEYERERGICTPIEKWPGIVCKNNEELRQAVRFFDESTCAKKAREHLQTFGSYETGTATKQVCKRMMEHMRKTSEIRKSGAACEGEREKRNG